MVRPSFFARRSAFLLLGSGVLASALGGCKVNLANELAKVPEAKGDSCVELELVTEPDLVSVDPAFRARLATNRKDGLVAVRYQKSECGLSFEVLDRCTVKGLGYEYRPYPFHDSQVITTSTELAAQLPLSAAHLEAGLASSSSYRFDYQMVGVAELTRGDVITRTELDGADCDQATHVVQTFYLGGFELLHGTKAQLAASVNAFGAGVKGAQAADRARASSDGTPEACRAALKSGKEDPNCAAALRVRLREVDPNLVTAGDRAAYRGDFDKARVLYTTFAKNEVNSSDARRAAARRAFDLVLTLSDRDGVAQTLTLWEGLNQDPGERARLRLLWIRHLLELGEVREAKKALGELDKALPADEPEMTVIHCGLMSEACAALGDTACVDQAYARASKAFAAVTPEWRDHLSKRDPELLSQILAGIGAATGNWLTLRARRDRSLARPVFTDQGESSVLSQMNVWTMHAVPTIRDYTTQAEAIVALDPPPGPSDVLRVTWTSMSLWNTFFEEFQGMPMPAAWESDPELLDAFRGALDDAAQPIRDNLTRIGEVCLSSAARLGVWDDSAQKCRNALSRHWPREYPPLPYFVPAPDHAIGGEWGTRVAPEELPIPFAAADRRGWSQDDCKKSLAAASGKDARSAFLRGLVHERCGNTKEALLAFDAALRAGEKDPLAEIHAARLHARLEGQSAPGLRSLDALNRSTGERDVPLLLALAELRSQALDLAGAELALRRAAELQPERAEVVARLAELHLAKGAATEGGAALLPRLDGWQKGLATSHSAMAYRLALLAVALDPNSGIAQNAAGRALAAYEASDRVAIDRLARASRALGCAKEPHLNRGSLLLRNHDGPGAEAAFKTALGFDPQSYDATLGLGVARAIQLDTQGAIVAFRKATKLDPERPEAHANLAWAIALKLDSDGGKTLAEGQKLLAEAMRAQKSAEELLPFDFDRQPLRLALVKADKMVAMAWPPPTATATAAKPTAAAKNPTATATAAAVNKPTAAAPKGAAPPAPAPR